MKKILILGIAVFASYLSNAQTDSISLTETVISDNRIQTQFSQFGKSLQLLNKKEIKLLPGKNMADYLSTVSGIDVRQRGPEGVQADIGIRGGNFDQSLLLLNNIKLNDPQTGHHNMNLPFTAEALDHIEVIKSAASRLYGINALSGAINFITKVPEKNTIHAGYYAGDFGLNGANIGASFHQNNLAQYLSYNRSSSNGYIPNTDFKNENLFYQATYVKAKSRFNLFGAYSSRNFGAHGFYVSNSNEYEQLKTAFGAFQYTYNKTNFRFTGQGYFKYNQDHYVYVRSNPSNYENFHYTHTQGLELHGAYPSKFGETGFGVDARIEQLNSNRLKDENGVGIHQRNITGLFVE
jgi:vitamin B12 transporter